MIFAEIETYIEFIAGYRDITGKQINYWPSPVIALASYDVGFVESVSTQTIDRHIALSTKQANLALQLIKKYERQLRSMSVQQPDHNNYRMPLRDVVHVNRLSLENNHLYFRFTFNNSMILDIKNFLKEAQGEVKWNKDAKAWVFALTEYNVSWAVAYAKAKKIPVDSTVMELFDLIVETEKVPYAIELRLNDKGTLYIENAADSLNEYIEKHIGFNNIYALVDSAGALGYTVSKEISEVIESEHSKVFMKLCANKNIDLDAVKESMSLDDIIEWAVKVDRLPICVYNPNFLKPDISVYQKYFEDSEIQVITMKDAGQNSVEVKPTTKIVYTNKILDAWEGRMPLLVSYANLMHGITKKTFMGKAEKVVYYCASLPRR